MNRRDAMLHRLPPIYSVGRGSLLDQVMSIVGGSLTEFDQEMNRVQRSHWLETAFDRGDLARLGALFDIAPAPWEPEHLYRLRLQATIAARLGGALTREVVETALVTILNAALEALDVRYCNVGPGRAAFARASTEKPREPAFIEFPPIVRRSSQLAEKRGLLRSLDKIVLTNRGLHPVPLHAVIRGVAGNRTLVPVLVNLTNHTALLYVGELPCGRELRLSPTADGVEAFIDEKDVRAQVFTGSGFVPGGTFSPIVPHPSPQPLRLERGENLLWFFPLALFDQRSLGSAVFGLPMDDLEHGQYGDRGATASGGTLFDHSLFEQSPAVSLDLWWFEAQPAMFHVEIPAGVVTRKVDPETDGQVERLRLFALLQQTVGVLRGAGVSGRVEPRALRQTQLQQDRLRLVPPLAATEEMPLEARLNALSALFDTSAVDGSRFS